MRIDVTLRGEEANPPLATHVKRRLHFALDRFAHRVHEAEVRLADANGPRGGIDKRCRILLRVQGLSPILVTAIDLDYRVAVDRAADKAGRVLATRVARSRSGRRRTSMLTVVP